ncbi:fibrillin [Echinococcus multilocularis]|uniref:Fibulin n=1 Tax=Echinococcus multilocularis TaxID=6211 RepID=A0A087W1G0_ECHMU|nr:fibrillin [Echinococcus multilocularis]
MNLNFLVRLTIYESKHLSGCHMLLFHKKCVMLPEHSLLIHLLCVGLLDAALFIPPSACRAVELSFAVCCSVGINSTRDMELDTLIKASNSDECVAIKQVDQIFKEIDDINADLPDDRMAKCLQVKRGCFYAAKANVFCENAARSIYSPDDKLTPISHFSPELLKSPRDCCKRHNRLPALDVVSDDSMDFDINGVPLCCTVKGYEVPQDLDPFANAITTRSSAESYERPTNSHRAKSTSVTVIVSVPSTTMTVTQSSMSTSSHNTKSYTEHASFEPITTTVNSTGHSYSYTYSTSPPLTVPSHSRPSYSPPPQTQRSTEAELVCEPGFTWNSEKQLCLHTLARCPKGMYLSVNQSKCLPKIGDRFKCPPGYEFRNDMNGCEDVNECEEGVLEGSHYMAACPKSGQQCINTGGSYECNCKQGFQKTRDGECVDIDECKASLEVCKAGYECRNVIGSFQCIRQVPCGFGYVLNSETQECEDIDECKAQPDICGPNMICVNVRGGMKCVPKRCPGKLRRNSNGLCMPCPSGYTFNERRNSCEDINECELNVTLCRTFERCTNRPGDYICEPKLRCEMGFQLNKNGTSCDDIDECKLRAFNCRHGQICVNTPGAYKCELSPCHLTERYDYALEKCVCSTGFQHRGRECVDIDECAEEEKHGDRQNPLCGSHQVCVNTVGAYRCVTLTDCPKGFHRTSPKASCTDINECATGEANCGPNMHCENTLGSYRCLCERGFKNINDTACADINECEVFRPEESCPDRRARCVNTAGSYRCICPNGFVWHSYPVYACRDVNECVLEIDTCGPEHRCVNDEGGYHCECAKGYRRNWDNRTCIDINECTEKGVGAMCQSGICVNTPGSFRCDCPFGFRLGKGGNCVDVNECQERDGICTSRHARGITFSCVNLHGSYRCVSERCPSMYVKQKIPNGYRCSLMPEYECNTFDPYCLKDRPLRIDHLHIELPSVLKKRIVLGELDSSVVKRGTVNVELLEHYAYDTRTKRHISVKNSLKLAVKASDRRTVELLLVRPIEPPADIFVSVRLSEMHGQRRKVRSNTRFYLYATENNNLNSTSTSNDIDEWRSKK